MFKDKVIYQLYPKSFYDSDNDGMGDLLGVIEKIPYLKKLGIDMVWLNPFYPSPQKDNGYDISNYCEVDARFGTLEIFEHLVQELKSNDIGVMLDMVFNHTSTEHEWFQRALAGEKEYQDYYILRPAKQDGSLPTNWQSKFGGNAWEVFGETDLYYLHLFDKTQADLNWRNPKVRAEMSEIVRFWMKKGVEGFRFDVINVTGKDENLEDAEDGVGKTLYTDQPIVHDYLEELARKSFGDNPCSITVGEMSATSIESCILYTQPSRKELDMVFNFHHLKVDYEQGEKWTNRAFDFQELTHLLHTWGEKMSKNNGWNALFWNNHDQPRALSRFGDDKNYRVESATMLAASIHLSRGTPYIYQGEEIGMTNPYFDSLDSYNDVESHNAYYHLLEAGKNEKEALQILQSKSRDNSRTPMQWSREKNAGFTRGEPWLAVANNYASINVASELENGHIFSFYQQLIQLRKDYPIIGYGDYQSYQYGHNSVYAYQRAYQGQKLLVLNNFYGKQSKIKIPTEFLQGKVLIGNYPEHDIEETIELAPYETLAIFI